MGINLTPYTVTATGTVTDNSTRIAGFTITNKGATDDQGVRFYQLETDGSLGTKIMDYSQLSSIGGNSPQISQTYDGQTGVYFRNGLYCSVDGHCKVLMMTI